MDRKILKLIGICALVTKILMFVYSLLAFSAFIFAIVSKFNVDAAQILAKFDLLGHITAQIFVIAVLFCLVKIFDTIKQNQKFFVYPVNLWVRAIAVIVLVSATLKNTLYNFFCGIFNSELKLSLMLKINFTSLIIGVALLILSFIIEHGNKLQQQDDETL